MEEDERIGKTLLGKGPEYDSTDGISYPCDK